MILGDPAGTTQSQSSSVTIGDVFRRIAAPRPDAIALTDPPNRESFTDGAPRRLTYAEVERTVAAIAARLRALSLPTDAVIGIQLPNVVENIVTILGVLRAGMIPAPLPLLWRRVEAAAALARVGAKALITCGRVGRFNHCRSAMRIAADVFSIRYVCGFGGNLPDGVVAFDEVFGATPHNPLGPPDRERQGNPAAHVALISFENGAEGIVPVARNHLEMLAGGLGIFLECGLAHEATILSTIGPSSFAGLCLTLLPWLLSGGKLVLHHPFAPDVFDRQLSAEGCDTVFLPAAVALRLGDAATPAREGIRSIVAAWRCPERLAASPEWREPRIKFVDVAIFGEAGMLAARRGADGKAEPLSFGPIATRRSAGGLIVTELVRTDGGSVALRGPMVPHSTFPPGVEGSGLPYFKIGRTGLVDTGYACRFDSGSNAIVITGPPSGIVSIGGYRFRLGALQDLVGRISGGATLAALPDPTLGQRLIGHAADRDAMRAVLDTAGLNPLVAAAFRERSTQDSPAGNAPPLRR